ncbi:MAG: DUF928 domain-containing protein [Coleofasciculus sp. S288]|nr:DUF928 domain-containing protein [Coleofasciculus sp. S288]
MKRIILLVTAILFPSLWLTTPVKAENQAINLTGASGLPTNNFTSLKAEILGKQQSTPRRLRRLRFRLPDITAAGNREPLASRGSCSANSKSVTALIPPTNIGFTVAAHPTFFFDISQTSARSAEFALFNQDGKEIYTTTVELSKRSGVVSFSLPQEDATSVSLEVGERYQWYFALICNPNDRSQDIDVTGAIERKTPRAALANQLRRAAPHDRPAIYAQEGFWFDTIKTLADLRSANPNDSTLTQEWENLLRSVGLDRIAQNRVLGNLAPKNE